MKNTMWDRNLKAMEKWYPEFSVALREGMCPEEDLEIVEETSWDGELIYKIRKDGRELYLNGKRNTKAPVELWRDRLGEIHKYSSVILLGIGSGRYLKCLLKNLDKTVNVMVYEPSATIFRRTLQLVDLEEEIMSRPIAFVVEGINGAEFMPVMKSLVVVETIEFMKQEVHPNYQVLFPEKIVEALRNIEKRTEDIFVNYRTGNLFATHLAKNQIQNMEALCEGYNTKRLSEVIPYDGPAILVAAGPSLNKNIQELKAAKNKAFILAVDTAVKPLVHAGIIPDAYITIDAKKPLNLVDEERVRNIPVIAPITANHDILKRQRGKKIFYFDGYMLGMYAYRAAGKILPAVQTGGSVACSGLSLLYKMGFNTIILVGQDLAYTDNKSHADGTFQDKMPTENTDAMIRVKGNYEEEVPTLANLKIYLDWFVMFVEGAQKRRNVRFINATAGGAYIEGTELMTLKEAIEQTCTKETDFEECIRHIKSEFDENERKEIVEYLHEIPKEFKEIEKIADSLFEAYHKVERLCKAQPVNKKAYLKQIRRIKKLSGQYESKQCNELINACMPTAEFVVKSESLYERDSFQEEGKAIAKQGMQFTKMLKECAEILGEFSEEVLLKIE